MINPVSWQPETLHNTALFIVFVMLGLAICAVCIVGELQEHSWRYRISRIHFPVRRILYSRRFVLALIATTLLIVLPNRYHAIWYDDTIPENKAFSSITRLATPLNYAAWNRLDIWEYSIWHEGVPKLPYEATPRFKWIEIYRDPHTVWSPANPRYSFQSNWDYRLFFVEPKWLHTLETSAVIGFLYNALTAMLVVAGFIQWFGLFKPGTRRQKAEAMTE